jgi:hypothetical protein
MTAKNILRTVGRYFIPAAIIVVSFVHAANMPGNTGDHFAFVIGWDPKNATPPDWFAAFGLMPAFAYCVLWAWSQRFIVGIIAFTMLFVGPLAPATIYNDLFYDFARKILGA